MSCVTCDGQRTISAPTGRNWLLTGNGAMPCPVCHGPHLRWLFDKLETDQQVVVCSADDCDVEIRSGWLVYAQMRADAPADLDEMIMLCCDDHAEQESDGLKKDGHPTVCLPFCVQDTQEVA